MKVSSQEGAELVFRFRARAEDVVQQLVYRVAGPGAQPTNKPTPKTNPSSSLRQVSLRSPGCPGTHFVDQADLKHPEICLFLPSTGIKSMCYHCPAKNSLLNPGFLVAKPYFKPSNFVASLRGGCCFLSTTNTTHGLRRNVESKWEVSQWACKEWNLLLGRDMLLS